MNKRPPNPTARPADYERILELLRERDRLLKEYVAARLYSDEQYWDWSRTTWKNYARNQLALLQFVRPLTYTDYRHRVTILSPTLGEVSSNRLLTGWMLDSEAELRHEAESAALALWQEPIAEPVAEFLPLSVLPAFVEPETPEPEPELLPPVVEEPLQSVEEHHAAPDFEGVFLPATASIEEAGQLVEALFKADVELYQVPDSTTLGELYQAKRALLLARSTAPSGAVASDDAARLAAIELRKRNRAKLQAARPAVIDALNSPTLSNSITDQ